MNSELILENLNNEQRNAVLQTDGPILIIAGAGSGKTRVLTSKVALLIERGVLPESILALTFTKKAAKEIKDRVRAMVGEAAGRVSMGTFHSVFAKHLRVYAESIGLSSDFTILDEDGSVSFLKRSIRTVLFGPDWEERKKNLTSEGKKEWKAKLKMYDYREIKTRISDLKNNLTFPDDYTADEENGRRDKRLSMERFGEIYRHYMRSCHRSKVLDFDDLLLFTWYLFQKNKDAERALGEQYKYILVDEYQDTNYAQSQIIDALAKYNRNICVVGDDSQSIYSFRGARIENILNFPKDYKGCHQFKLVNNYRSTADIVNAANRLIESNRQGIRKECIPIRGEGESISVSLQKDDKTEAEFIAADIAALNGRGVPYSDFAILYRTNAQARVLEDIFRRRHLPYIVYSGISFFDREEIKDVLAYLKLVVNHDDDESFSRICNKPSRGISYATLAALQAQAELGNKSLFQAAKDGDLEGMVRFGAIGCLNDFCKMIEDLSFEAAHLNAFESAKMIIEKTGIYALYFDKSDDDGTKRVNNIGELMNSVSYFIEEQLSGDDLPMTSLNDYLTDVSLLSSVDMDDDDKKTPRISLMTAHCAKGLEFPRVYVIGVEHGLFPYIKDGDCDLEEERRLFYVAITRAQDKLTLTLCKERFRYGERQELATSQFLSEMGIVVGA